MSLHASMSPIAIQNRIDRDQTGAGASTIESQIQTLLEVIQAKRNWIAYYQKRGNTKAAERTAASLPPQVAQLEALEQARILANITPDGRELQTALDLRRFERQTRKLAGELESGYPGQPARRAAFVAQIETRNLNSHQVARIGMSTIASALDNVEKSKNLWMRRDLELYECRLQDEIEKERTHNR
jgi:hypothetical protein